MPDKIHHNQQTTDDAQPPFGTYALAPWRDTIRRLSGPWREKVRLIGSTMWKASALGLGEPLDVEPASGFKVRLYPGNNTTDKKAYMGLEIGPENADINAMGQAARDCTNETFQFLDIGGNSGMYSIAAAQAAKLAGKAIRIIAVEANPDMAKRYTFNLAASGIDDVTIINSAVSDHNGTVLLDISTKANLGQAKVVDGKAGGKGIEVPARLLEDILDEAAMPHIDFMKIDIEGHEVPALAPFLGSVHKARYPRQILIEIAHDHDDKINSLLTNHGYTLTADLDSDAVYTLQEDV